MCLVYATALARSHSYESENENIYIYIYIYIVDNRDMIGYCDHHNPISAS